MTANNYIGKVGNIARAPELSYGKTGTAFCRFGLAWTPYSKDGEPEAVYYDVVCFKSLAENVAECLQKGDRVVVLGRGEVETWVGRDGQERTSKKILADAVGPELRFRSTALTARARAARSRTSDDPD
jgi:single-strand DNA-binding protein